MNTTTSPRSQKSPRSISNRAGAFIRKRSAILAAMIGLVGIAMTGCSNPTEPVESTNEGVVQSRDVRPGIGSTYIYKVSSEKKATPGVHYYDTLVVTRTGLRLGNYTNVVEFRHKYEYENEYSYMYLSYAANGDVIMRETQMPLPYNADSSDWMTLPVGSRIGKREKYDLFYDYESMYLQPEEITVGSNVLTSHKVSSKLWYVNDGEWVSRLDMYWWFSPVIGNLTGWESKWSAEGRYELIAYTLKP